ncbi:histidine kinase [Streptomyces sp. NBC_01142]|uniref:sensor histidine kinase n=1 Tax=Streptomyces sp. NBC_01142 TaxID=2975865 RepID=UPI00225752F8|nr:histidine kinase [Streptomyces sp. NBC_01142]MCX4819708.1 histidine kinase [Streptomyces sp. NBC_01142]
MRRAVSARPRVLDIGVALLVQAVMTVPWLIPRQPGMPDATLVAYLLTTLTVVPLIWRRRAPVGVLLAVGAAQLLYVCAIDGPGQTLPYVGLVALYTIATLSPSPRRQIAGGLVIASVFPSVRWNSGEVRELLFSLIVFTAAYVLGRLTHTRQAYTRAVEDRAAQLERTHRIEAEQAAARERARIAREMHDILSHAVSIMIVQAEAGPVAIRSAPERAEAAFDSISETGRDAMVQLRRLLGVLREDGAPPDAPREPQPALAELPALVERVAGSGLRVSYETAGRARPLPMDTEATVFRVVQEALTNVVKHASASAVTVQLTYGNEELMLTVTDDGRGPGITAADRDSHAQSQSQGRSQGQGQGQGHGLIGIRERAAAHGGTADTGPGPGGRGFRVRVRLPLVTSPLEVGN